MGVSGGRAIPVSLRGEQMARHGGRSHDLREGGEGGLFVGQPSLEADDAVEGRKAFLSATLCLDVRGRWRTHIHEDFLIVAVSDGRMEAVTE